MALYYISGKTAAGAVQRKSSRRYLSCSIYCKSFKSIISILFLHQLLQYSFQAFLDRSDVLVVNIGCIHAAAPSSAENAGLLLNCLRHYSTPHPVFMSQKTPSKDFLNRDTCPEPDQSVGKYRCFLCRTHQSLPPVLSVYGKSVIHRAAPLPQVEHGSQCTGNVIFGILHGHPQVVSFCQIGRNRRGQCASCPVGVGIVNAVLL